MKDAEKQEKTENKEKSTDKKTTKKTKKLSQLEYEKKVIELSDKGLTSEKIGEELRSQDIHPSEYKKKISKILIDKGKYINPDLKNVEEKLNRIKTHAENNRQDKRAKREKDRVFAQLRKLKKYHKVEVK